MKIIRDQKEFELTREELFQAYEEMQQIYDMENIENNMEAYLDAEEYDILKNNEKFVSDVAINFRYELDDDYFYEKALARSFEKTTIDYLIYVNKVICLRSYKMDAYMFEEGASYICETRKDLFYIICNEKEFCFGQDMFNELFEFEEQLGVKPFEK